MHKIFIDGSAGTTGLRIHERLRSRDDIELITLSGDMRKDPEARKEAFYKADIAFLCLPDAAAREAAELAAGSFVKIIDTSTAHRTEAGWVYGFPELKGKRELIRKSEYIANPGCHASGFIALTAPLIEVGLLKKEAALCCFSITGYSGGGKKMIAEYENGTRDPLLSAPRQYGISQNHKHLREMTLIPGLARPPVFCPVVADFYSGMEVTVPVFKEDLNCGPREIKDLYRDYYRDGCVHFSENADNAGFISGMSMSGRDDMIVTVSGNEDRILLISLFDNLGKGASGAAIQNMNLLMGADETTGLILN